MIRGVTPDEDDAKLMRFLALRAVAKATWVGTIAGVIIAVILPFIPYPRLSGSITPRRNFALVINRVNRDRPVVQGSVVRASGGKAYILTVAGNTIKETDVGKSVEVWFPWFPRDRTISGIIKVIHQTRMSPPERDYSGYLALVEVDAPAEAEVATVVGGSLEKDVPVDVWGVDTRSLRAGRLSSAGTISKIYGDAYFAVSVTGGEVPSGGAVLVMGKLGGVIADNQLSGAVTGRSEVIGISAVEIQAAMTKVGR